MKKLIALLLALVMVLALAACAAKTEPAKTETTDTKTEQTTTEETKTEDPAPAEETTGEKMYIPVMAKGFQHQFWQAVAKGSEDAANDLGVEIYFDGPASETEIDAQVNMVKTELAKNPKAMALAALSTDAVTEILEECAEKNIPVIFCNDAHLKGIDHELKFWGDHAIAGTEGAKVIPELEVCESDYIVPKRRYSGFFHTDLDLLLRELGVNTVVLTGLHTHMCVRHTAADAYQLGYDVVAIKDATNSFTAEDYEYGLSYLKGTYDAEITDTDTFLASL